jgi:hypothetical protein
MHLDVPALTPPSFVCRELAALLPRALASSVLVSVLLAVPAETQDLRVAPAYPVDAGPLALVTGDFNGDGRLDVAVANQSVNTVSILFGAPRGTAPTRQDHVVGQGPAEIVVAHFNGDTALDLAVSGDHEVSVLINDGTGGFTVSAVPNPAFDADALSADDFDGDGHPDLAVGGRQFVSGSFAGSVWLLRGNGAGGFSSPGLVIAPFREDVQRVRSADLNGDGARDLVVAATTGPVSAIAPYLGQGNGTFVPLGSPFLAFSNFLLGDWNGDARPDLVTPNTAATDVYLGQPTGAFQLANSFPPGGVPVAAGDFNGDLHPDLASIAQAPLGSGGVITLAQGMGNGSFVPGQRLFVAGAAPFAAMAGDFDLDGRLDLAVSNLVSQDVSYMYGDGGLKLAAAVAQLTPQPPVQGLAMVASGDFNRDGAADVVLGHQALLGDGTGGLAPPVGYETAIVTGVAVGLLDADGDPDLVATRNGNNGMAVYRGNGAGGFTLLATASGSTSARNPVLADLNGDGHTDVVAIPNSTGVLVYLGDGTGQLGAPATFGTADAKQLRIGHVDGDAHLDLVISTFTPEVQVLLGDGAGGFGQGPVTATPVTARTHVVGDFDEDGHLDLAFSAELGVAPQGSVYVLLGNGTGGFGPAQQVFTGPYVSSLAAEDFDLDGHADLAVATTTSDPSFPGANRLVVLRGTGDGAFVQAGPWNVGRGGAWVTSPEYRGCSLATGDFDGDTSADLVCHHGYSVSLVLNDTIGVRVASLLRPEGHATSLSTVTATLTRAVGHQVTVDYTTADGTATAGSDYVPTGGTLTFPPGVTSRTLSLTVLGDRIQEGDEAILLSLSGASGAALPSAQAVVTLSNDDAPGLVVSDIVVAEGANARFNVTLTPASTSTVTVSYATLGGTAAPGVDYTPVAGVLSFDPGMTTVPIDVSVLFDPAVEAPETFFLELGGAVNAPIAYGTGTALILDRPRGADFNADSSSDLVWRHQGSGQNVLWYMNGTSLVSGTFTNPAVLADTRWTVVGTNDFDADGQADILWRHATSGENVLWFMNGADLVSGTFTTPSALADVRWSMVGTGDFDLDGSPDILWRHGVSGENVLWYMNGSVLAGGTFTTPAALTDVRWKMAGVGDFNRDGKPDILWHHTVAGQIVLWYMDGSVLVGGTFTTPPAFPDVGWQMVAVGDYNADERPDIVWRHQTSGQNAVWFMNDGTLMGGAFTTPSTVPDLGWKLVGPR